ncbi:hypothetical protein HUW51_08525 [Adhaeribacter swui]|uniref:Heavy metal binding domain-containing protein n=1 Tax=Adhaeribacter swui TaxID=2086471 RepID=A0A7G7G2N2_9BACT|nr:heavy metal-binding domain-containing protein [Adhaeribacter swui]QNF31416.1 hypothetical protein HUW51_08525 [Adhaeribacter swui]
MNFKKIALGLALVSSGYLSACNKPATEENTTATEAAETSTPSTAADSASTAQFAYICPMKCEGSASHEPGKCPVCSMDLVKNPDFKGTASDSTAL